MGSGELSWIVLGVTTLGVAVLVAVMLANQAAVRQASRRVATILHCGWIAWHSGVSLRSLLLSPGLNTVSDVVCPLTVRPTASRWPLAREPGPHAAASPPAMYSVPPLRSLFDPR